MKSWEPEEDEILKLSLLEIGPRWKEIAKRLPGRTEAMCRNRRQRMEAARRAGATARNRCLVCGEMKKGHTCQRRAELNALGYQRGGPQPLVSTLSDASTASAASEPESLADAEPAPPMVRRVTTDECLAALDRAQPVDTTGDGQVDSLALQAEPRVAPVRADDVAMADLEAAAVELRAQRAGEWQPPAAPQMTPLTVLASPGAQAEPPMVQRGADVPLGSFCSFGSVSVDLTWRGWQDGENADTNTVALQELAATELSPAAPAPIAPPPRRPSDSVAEAFALPPPAAQGRGAKRPLESDDAMLEELAVLESKRQHTGGSDATAPTAPNSAPASPTVSGVPVDTNGDGVMDSVAVDTTQDGLPDAIARCATGVLVDTTGDGLVDSLAIDTTRDGQVDTIVSIADAASARMAQSAAQQQHLRRLVEAKQQERQAQAPQPQGLSRESSGMGAIDMGVLLEEADRRVSIDGCA